MAVYIHFNSFQTMVTKKECHGTYEGKTDQDNYQAPEINILEITLEKGFAGSSTSGTEDWGSVSW
jgi:hypothetical protein